MARYTGPVCKLCRREGQKLFLKGTKCFTEKCPVERRPYAPGQHGQTGGGRRKKASEYAHQLREKQKVKRIYGVAEKPFRNLFEKAAHQTGVTGENLLVALESRLDNVVYRMGFGSSRKEARQLIRHRHVQVNGHLVDIPSAQVAPGDEVRIAAKSKDILPVQASLAAKTKPTTVAWLAVDEGSRTGRMVSRPTRADIPLAVQEQLIVELYSK
ncbi:30S ribosomal protein S4 [Longimicrobium sp.]|jgi:small subunit ribosomal protein S4|uniref:30S ribosomal protein S4 n=1 Tax=Longimicrobium sp. TaxID=2029185 RepID=UPI002E3499EE|nr:30S ribosomal protein S4 [Longimicrobium sp.]HEX6039726.1 30S ribosomal protein S4 [Longimicrobium sp.]